MTDTEVKKPQGKIQALLDSWRRFAFANSATRREAKALLFQELAASVRNGMPLDEALEYCMRTAGEARMPGKQKDASNRYDWYQSIMAVLYLVFATCGSIVLLLFMSAWAADVERVARVYALRLLPLVRAGHTLSDAMAANSGDFSDEELQIIKTGESWNRLPEALDSLGQFQYYERELQRHWARMAYPVGLFALLTTIVAFCAVFILPKFNDIYIQLGMELPAITQWLMTVTTADNSIVSTLLAILVISVPPFAFFVLLRLTMIGSRTLRDMLLVAIVIAASFGGFSLVMAAAENMSLGVGTASVVVIGIVLMALVGILAGPLILYIAEELIRYLEWSAAGIFGSLPLIGAPQKTEQESRWLSALALGISSGQDPAEAVAVAGKVCAGEMRTRSDAAAERVRKGYPIGQAVVESRVLRPTWAHRLRLLDNRGHYVAGLQEIADDATRHSYNVLNRSSRIAEVMSVCLMGVCVGLFAYAMYLPLFSFPFVVGVE